MADVGERGGVVQVVEEEGSVRAEDVADVKPEDEVGLIGKVGAYAGMAAAGLGAATLAGGIAVDMTDVALIAGVYGVATAIGSSQNSAIRAKGAAGPVLSAFVTAADIARRIQGGSGGQKKPSAVHDRLGKYQKSKRADVSSQSESAAEVTKAMVAAEAEADVRAKVSAREAEEAALAVKVASRVAEMRSKLGPSGMQALEDGVNQVMSTDVQRILKVRPPATAPRGVALSGHSARVCRLLQARRADPQRRCGHVCCVSAEVFPP